MAKIGTWRIITNLQYLFDIRLWTFSIDYHLFDIKLRKFSIDSVADYKLYYINLFLNNK